MAARREIMKKYVRGYARAGKIEKGHLLDSLVATAGWTRGHARRAIRAAAARRGGARDQQRKPKPRKYSYDTLVVLQEAWRRAGQPCSKYLAAIMGDTRYRLMRDHELGKVADRITPEVLDELRAMSGATIGPVPQTPPRRRLPSRRAVRHPAQPHPALLDPGPHRH